MKKVILFFGSAIIVGGIIGYLIPKDIHSVFSKSSASSIVLPPSSNQVEAAINNWRTTQGLAVFNIEVPALDQAAQARAEGMCAENDWSHNRDWEVLGKYYAYTLAGENLYYSSLREDQPTDAVTTWVNSPSHLANLQKNYAEIGIGVKLCPMFQGYENVVIITNYFGVPR